MDGVAVKLKRELYVESIKQSHYRPRQAPMVPGGWGSKILRQSVNKDNKVVSPTHRPPLPPENISGTYFCKRLSRPQGHSAAGRIMSMKNSNYTIGNRSCYLPVCSAVPQPLRHRVPVCALGFRTGHLTEYLVLELRTLKTFAGLVPRLHTAALLHAIYNSTAASYPAIRCSMSRDRSAVEVWTASEHAYNFTLRIL
jgi:hypothetical protein